MTVRLVMMTGKVDWTSLGWTDNPFKGGGNGPGTRTGGVAVSSERVVSC